jgi:hypothetical protein
MREDTRICVFFKPPIAGQVKTRLISAVGAEGAAALAGSFFRDTWNSVESLSWAVPVVASTDSLGPEVLPKPDTDVWLQGDGDLGARIERILTRALTHEPLAMALGADSPGIPPRFLERAHEALRSADAVLGPCEDGGFYLLGVRECPPGLLGGIPWSQSTTFASTLERLERRGLKVTTLDSWYDIDRPEDLERLWDELASGATTATHTMRVLTGLRGITTTGSPVAFRTAALDSKEGGPQG